MSKPVTPLVRTIDWDSLQSVFLKKEPKKVAEYIFTNKTFYKNG